MGSCLLESGIQNAAAVLQAFQRVVYSRSRPISSLIVIHTTDRETLAIFAELVEAKSFAEASRRLNMPTILLSQRLAELEDHIGAPLLLRSTPNFQLTDVGATGA